MEANKSKVLDTNTELQLTYWNDIYKEVYAFILDGGKKSILIKTLKEKGYELNKIK